MPQLPPTLITLPKELLARIVSHLSRFEGLTLALVSPTLIDLANEAIWRDLVLDSATPRLDRLSIDYDERKTELMLEGVKMKRKVKEMLMKGGKRWSLVRTLDVFCLASGLESITTILDFTSEKLQKLTIRFPPLMSTSSIQSGNALICDSYSTASTILYLASSWYSLHLPMQLSDSSVLISSMSYPYSATVHPTYLTSQSLVSPLIGGRTT